MYDNPIRCQTLEEILADKLISFSATDPHIRHRDLWDIPWIVRAQEIDFSAVAALVAAKHDDYRCPVPHARMIAVGMQRAHVCYADGSFTGQMQRFLSPAVLDRTHDFDNHCDALNTIVEKCFGRVVTSSVSQMMSSVPDAGSRPRYRWVLFRLPCYRKGPWGFLKVTN
ncbi:MAG: nucleotidyl transferase AbiEii/AbiGii toxin family protein [Eggerthellaceae bacterium]